MLPAPLLWLVVFFMFSLQISLLQLVLDRWWPHVVAMSRVPGISGADGISLGAQNVLFGIPLRPLWHPGGP